MDREGESTVLRDPFRCPVLFGELHVHVDGAAKGNPGPAGIGVVVRTEQGETVAEFGMPIGEATNNYAEYTALVHALRLLSALRVERVVVYTDSELVSRQISGEYRVREQSLKSLHAQVMHMLSLYKAWRVEHVRREENREADRLASKAAEGRVASAHGRKEWDGFSPEEDGSGEDPRLF